MACRQVDDKQSLQGKWLFALDPNDIGLTEQWYNKSLNYRNKDMATMSE